MTEGLSPAVIIRAIDTSNSADRGSLRAYWLHVEEGGRDALRHALLGARGDRAIVPLVVRERGFDDSNALLNDLLRVINVNREEFESVRDKGAVTIVLLARDRLRVPQLSSPMTLPAWFPVQGGMEVLVEIQEFFSQAKLTLADPDLKIAELGALLLGVEKELVAAFERNHARSQNTVMAAIEQLKRDQSETPSTIIGDARKHVDGATQDGGYRPSLKAKNSLLSRILFSVTKTSPDKLPSLASALAKAIGRNDVEKPERSIFGLLYRPADEPAPPVLFAHNLLATIYAAYQLSTAAAHADAYPGFPLGVVHQVSVNVRASLRTIIGALSADRAAVSVTEARASSAGRGGTG